MNQTQSQPIDVLSLPGFIKSVRGHKGKVILTFVVIFFVMCFYTVNRGRDYESTSKLFIRKGRETVTVDPLAAASGQVMSVTNTQDREINSIVSILRNRDLLEQVVDQVGVDTILDYQDPESEAKQDSAIKQAMTDALESVKSFMLDSGWLERLSEREEAIATLRDSLGIEAGTSAVIKVSVTADSPKLAQLLNLNIIEAYTSYHMAASKSSGSFDFFDEQTASQKKLLKSLNEKLADLKIKNNVASLSVKKEVMERQMLAIDNLRISATADFAASTSRIEVLERQVDESVTRVREQLQINLMEEQANNASYAARLKELAAQRELLVVEVKNLNTMDYEMTELERQIAILEANYRRRKENLEQVRITKELEERSISNINVIQNPSFVDYPVGPANKVMFAMGLIIAFCLSCAVGVLSELYCPHQQRLEAIARAREIRENRRRRRRPVAETPPREVESHA